MKKRISIITVLIVIASLCFTLTAFGASSYTASLIFQGEHTGPVRSHSGSDLNWKGYTYTQYQEPVMPTTFTIYLYRKNFIGSTEIGSVTRDREGYHNVSWTNIGSEKYYFFYVKARDGANVVSDSITMSMS